MAKFKKAILQAGRTYHSPDGKVTVTPERLQHWAGEFKKLTGNGYVVPIDWDHAADLAGASPIALSKFKRRSSKNTVGKLADFKVSADGQRAEVLLDITDPAAQGRADRNEVYVSPVIFEQWADGAKNQYADVITHVDIVNHPVDHSQGPFEPAEPGTVALGIRMGLSGVYRMGDGNRSPFGDGDDDEESGDQGGNDDDTQVEDKNPDMPKVEGDDKVAEAIRAHFEILGVCLSSDWSFTSEGAGKELLAALKTLVKAEQDAQAEEASSEEGDDSNGGSDMAKVEDPGYAAMSLQARTALTFAEGQHRDGLKARADKALAEGRCSPKQHEEIMAAVPAIRLSLNTNGQHEPTIHEMRLATLEQNPEGTFWDAQTRTAKVQMSLVEPSEQQKLGADAEAIEYAKKLAMPGRK